MSLTTPAEIRRSFLLFVAFKSLCSLGPSGHWCYGDAAEGAEDGLSSSRFFLVLSHCCPAFSSGRGCPLYRMSQLVWLLPQVPYSESAVGWCDVLTQLPLTSARFSVRNLPTKERLPWPFWNTPARMLWNRVQEPAGRTVRAFPPSLPAPPRRNGGCELAPLWQQALFGGRLFDSVGD